MRHPIIKHPPGFASTVLSMTLVAITLASPSRTAAAQRPGPPGAAFTSGVAPDTLESVVIHPFVAKSFSCSEHPVVRAEAIILGDAAAADCLVVHYDQRQSGRRPPSYYLRNGLANEDWRGWREPLLAPFDGVVEEIHINDVVNHPGTPGSPPAGFIVFRRADGTRVVYAHIQEPAVKQGDTIRAGEPVARIGNNGIAYMPHTHIGAWRNNRPLQIRLDLKAMGRLERE